MRYSSTPELHSRLHFQLEPAPDDSGAEYQVASTDPLTHSLIPNSGHDENGDPENDSGEVETPPTYYGLTSKAIIFPTPVEVQLVHDEEIEESRMGPEKINYGGAAIMGLCGPGCGGIFGSRDWSFTQCAVTGSC